MANNLYPQHMTENIIKNCLDNHFQTNEESDTKTVEFYYQLGNISTFKQDTKALKDIIQRYFFLYIKAGILSDGEPSFGKLLNSVPTSSIFDS